jgi:hypothetical protein
MHEDFSKSKVFCGAAFEWRIAYSRERKSGRLPIRLSNQQGRVLLNSVSPPQKKERISPMVKQFSANSGPPAWEHSDRQTGI